MSNTYSLTFINDSENDWSFCCYQEDPNITMQGVMSLAWFAFPVASTTSVTFQWNINYQFVWSQMGKLSPGVLFKAGQKWDADLQTANSVDFTRKSNTAFSFENLTTGSAPGTLYINQDGTIPLHTAAIGINMGIQGAPAGAGSGTFVVPAQPNIIASFTPHPTYWVTFGDYVAGQVLDTQQIGQKEEIKFPVNVYDMCAILGPDNKWTTASLQEVNTAYLKAGGSEKLPHALRINPKLLR
ncbi:protein rhiA [Rhizobium sp. XQZ8]|uniref:protein rhiA n=1 Tax=Rhizobium populisoli TaxID=2859785 RepID=UPI001CA4F47E|nr:protein rhiA [Rhizobium populisoli]MBW6421663.1 protein rhiA [Rhizobium populisoli]